MVHARPSQPHRLDKSRELQRRLYLAAKRSRNRRFHALFDRIVRPDVLWRAWEEVRANRGRAEVDGVRIEDVERAGVDAYLTDLAADLKAQGYHPQPVLIDVSEEDAQSMITLNPQRIIDTNRVRLGPDFIEPGVRRIHYAG